MAEIWPESVSTGASSSGNDGGGSGSGGVRDSEAPYFLDKFSLFETSSFLYMIGRDQSKKYWRVLKIDKSDPTKLDFYEDPTVYSFSLCKALLQDIAEANKTRGGLKFVTYCYGIIGFIRLLGPYYIIVITKRKKIGQICDHLIYAIAEYKMIPIAQPTVLSSMDNFERENRYKKLLELVDLRKDFYFSYSYPIMHSLQTNLGRNQGEHYTGGTKFVWNENITLQIRNNLKNAHWTVALLHGFFKQVMLSARGKTFKLTLIARRSTQSAGTRYNQRGVDEKGHAANHVEIEQIVCEEIGGEGAYKCTSAVQTRGSIPLFWSQKPSLFNPKPDILLSEGNNNNEATELHFQNLRLRYGDPVIILNLTKTDEKHAESLLYNAFLNAVTCINNDLDEENKLTFWKVDLNTEFRTKGSDVLAKLTDLVTEALKQIGFFSCQTPQTVNFKASFDLSYLWINNEDEDFENNKHQKGILRTNCLDSLDRTNVVQYMYGFAALDQQLDALEITGCSEQNLEHTLAKELMRIYEAMGNSLARQYGGSAAHTEIFSKIRGRCPAATLIQECMISIQRHYNNIVMDGKKQQAIDL
ncbi:hypothetical protein RND81_05G242000 [Saponaria officinalis]